MKLYLSSYKLGNKTEVLKKWIEKNGSKIVIIANSRDCIADTEEKEESIKRNIRDLQDIGFEVTRIDLRDYFNNNEKLKGDLSGFHAFYVIGGNTYTLRLAMKYSGFDDYIKKLSNKEEYLYAGYSAGICVLSPTLMGLDIVDEPVNPYNNEPVLYDGVGLLDYTPVPHYKSDHPESKLVDKVVKLFDENELSYKTLRDAEVIIENIEEKSLEK